MNSNLTYVGISQLKKKKKETLMLVKKSGHKVIFHQNPSGVYKKLEACNKHMAERFLLAR